MFQRARHVLQRLVAATPAAADEPLTHWCRHHGLNFSHRGSMAFAIEGAEGARIWRAACGPSSRGYIAGHELLTRVHLGRDDGNLIVVMHRSLRRDIEAVSQALFSQVTGDLQTLAQEVPEEVRWVSTLRDTGWQGPPAAFWERYAVLANDPSAARRWIDEEAVERLLGWPTGGVTAQTPLLISRQRGRLQLRLQMDPPADPDTAVHALDLLRLLAGQAT
jgi:hypothetical protein